MERSDSHEMSHEVCLRNPVGIMKDIICVKNMRFRKLNVASSANSLSCLRELWNMDLFI